LALKLKERGHEVVVLSDEKQQYLELPGELAQAGIKHYTTDAIDRLDPVSMFKGVKDLKTIFRKEGVFEIIHAGGIKHVVKTYLATKGLNEKPKTFATIRSLPRSKIGVAMAVISYNSLVNKSIALCNYTKREMEKWGVNSDKIVAIPIFAPDLEWFDDARRRDIPLKRYGLQHADRPVVFYAAGHVYYKGFLYYLKAAKKVLRRFDGTFIVGGQGPLTESLRDLSRRLGIHEHVFFTGWISNYHMPYVLSNIADICVSASLREQFPSYIMECMAAGKSIVATNIGGVSEAVIDGVNGYLVPPRDSTSLAKAILMLLNDPDKARQMGEKGRRIVEQRFNMDAVTSKLDDVYEMVLQGK
jgi:glycosyltransferase involved in cell wall biosynthesis